MMLAVSMPDASPENEAGGDDDAAVDALDDEPDNKELSVEDRDIDVHSCSRLSVKRGRFFMVRAQKREKAGKAEALPARA